MKELKNLKAVEFEKTDFVKLGQVTFRPTKFLELLFSGVLKVDEYQYQQCAEFNQILVKKTRLKKREKRVHTGG
jgi:hypothetical protein